MDLLADVMVEFTEHDSLSRETVRRRLAKDELKPWRKDIVLVIRGRRSEASGNLLRRKPDPVDRRDPFPDPARAGPTRAMRYMRNGEANLFVFLDTHKSRPHKSRRHVKATDHRAACDLADTHCPDAARIRVVMDNLSTHTAGALYETFPAPEAHRILRRLES